jgi:hypothetical protein
MTMRLEELRRKWVKSGVQNLACGRKIDLGIFDAKMVSVNQESRNG